MELAELEATVAALYRKSAALRWRQAHGEDIEAVLNAIDAALGEAYAGFAAAQRADLSPERIGRGDRRLQIQRRAALRAAVEQDSEAAELRNRLDVRSDYLKIAGPRPAIAADDPDPARREMLWLWRNELGRLMKPDLLALMRRRNELARGLGYADYPALMLTAQETPTASLASFVGSVDAPTERPYRAALATLPEPPRACDEAMLAEWLAASAAPRAARPTGAGGPETHTAVLAAIRDQFAALGVDLPEARLEILIADQDLAVGCALATDAPREAKVVLRPLPIPAFRPLASHELGHAAQYLSLCDDPTLGLIDPGFDEAVATYFEGLADWSGGSATRLDGGPAELAELRRLIASHRFELAAYRDLDADLDVVYAEHQEAIRGFVTPPSPIWAIDSFRAIDPLYIHYYIIARSAAAAMRRCAYRTTGAPYSRAYTARITAACRSGMVEPWLDRLARLASPA